MLLCADILNYFRQFFILLKLQIWRSVIALQEIIVFKNTKTILKPSRIKYSKLLKLVLEFGTASHRGYVDQKIETSVESYVKKRHFIYSVFEFFFNNKCAWLSENLTLQKHTALGPNENIHLVICVQMWAQGRI